MDQWVKAAFQFSVRGYRQHRRGQENQDQSKQVGEQQNFVCWVRGPKTKRRARRAFGNDQRTHHVGRPPDMPFLKLHKLISSHKRHNGVVHPLHVHDNARHQGTKNCVEKQKQHAKGMIIFTDIKVNQASRSEENG